jgi:predicted ATPase
LHIESHEASDQFSLLLSYQESKTPINVADAGFGVSQVLPILVQATTARPDSLTLVEQPEAHLNPRQQVVLAELFADMAKRGARALVETHSEHILVALRRLVASGALKANEIAIYFVERSGFKSTARQVPIEDNGHIDRTAWPKDFFQEGLREAIALAEAQARVVPKRR